jgi:hypothetical protein
VWYRPRAQTLERAGALILPKARGDRRDGQRVGRCRASRSAFCQSPPVGPAYGLNSSKGTRAARPAWALCGTRPQTQRHCYWPTLGREHGIAPQEAHIMPVRRHTDGVPAGQRLHAERRVGARLSEDLCGVGRSAVLVMTQRDGQPGRVFIHRRAWTERPQLPHRARLVWRDLATTAAPIPQHRRVPRSPRPPDR